MLAPKFSLGGGQPVGEEESPPTIIGLVPKQGRLLAPHKRAREYSRAVVVVGNDDSTNGTTDTILCRRKSRYVRSG
jgi:hypothetical protein